MDQVEGPIAAVAAIQALRQSGLLKEVTGVMFSANGNRTVERQMVNTVRDEAVVFPVKVADAQTCRFIRPGALPRPLVG